MLRIIPAAAGSAIGFALLVAAPLSAQHVEHITPAEQVTLAAWTGRMNVMLDREISRSSAIWSKVANEGVVRVKFNCSENGRPDKVTLLKGSGNAALDAQALHAVERLASLHPLPTGFKPDQKFVAVLVFASDAYDPRMKAARGEQRLSNEWYRDPATAARNENSGGQLLRQ